MTLYYSSLNAKLAAYRQVRNMEQKNIEIQQLLNDIVKNQNDENYDFATKLNEIEKLKSEIFNNGQYKPVVPIEITNVQNPESKDVIEQNVKSIVQDLIDKFEPPKSKVKSSPKKSKKIKSLDLALEEKPTAVPVAKPVNDELKKMKRPQLIDYIKKHNYNINIGPDAGAGYKKNYEIVDLINQYELSLR